MLMYLFVRRFLRRVYNAIKLPSFEKIWTRNNMDQNNDGPEQSWTFWDFFFLWTYFSGPTYVWGFFVLVQNFDRESRARSACDDRLCGEKARNGSTGPHISRDAPPTCGTESPEWVYRATYKPRCPANVRYRKLGMGLKMDKFKKKKPTTDGPEITWTRTMMDQNNYGLFGIFFFFGDMTLVTYRRKSFSMREDDSCAPHSPHTLCQYNRLDRLVWEGLGFLLSLSSILNNFERSFIYFSKKKKKKKKKKV